MSSVLELALHGASNIAGCLGLAWSAVLAWLAIGAVIRRAQLQTRFRSQAPTSAAGRAVVLIRPCAGFEAALLDNLLSIRGLTSDARISIIMTIDSPDDGARPVIEAAIEQLRPEGFDVALEVHPPTGPNRKASMLAAVLRDHGSDAALVVNVDSNIDLAGFDLDALLAPLHSNGRTLHAIRRTGSTPRIGVAWSPWTEAGGSSGWGARASVAVLGGSLTAFPLLCALHPNGLVGKIWAARIDALSEAGDFGELADYLGEDLEMVDRLRGAGWSVAVVPLLGLARGGRPSVQQVIERFGRWMLVVRGQQPRLLPSYPLCFFATPMVSGLALLGAFTRPIVAIVTLGLAASARMVITLAARYWSGRGLRPLAAIVDAVLSDLVLMLAWLRAVSRREVEWRGHRLRVEPGGQLSAVDPVSRLRC